MMCWDTRLSNEANVLDITREKRTMKITARRNDDVIMLPGYISIDLDAAGD